MMNYRFVEKSLLAQTAGYVPLKTLWRIETALQAHFLLWFNTQTTHHLLLIIDSTEIKAARLKYNNARHAYLHLICWQVTKEQFCRKGVWYLCSLERISLTEAIKTIAHIKTFKVFASFNVTKIKTQVRWGRPFNVSLRLSKHEVLWK